MRFEERYERMRRLRPTARQVYALAVELCELKGEPFPETAAEMADLIERLREANGHPTPRLEDTPLRPAPPWMRGARRRRRMRWTPFGEAEPVGD
jgi:hypothetical protein